MKRDEVVQFFDRELSIRDFSADHSNNGLQVEGRGEVRKILFGVDSCQALFERAAELNADMIFTHHGLSWGSQPKYLTGMTAKRYGTLFRHGISLYSAHLPLDAHAEFGNNAVLLRMAELRKQKPFFTYDGVDIGFTGETDSPERASCVAERLDSALPGVSRSCGDPEKMVRKVAVVSGGGGLDSVIQAAAAGADMLITGELEHVMYHPARELGLFVLALGHYRSECTGPRALMERTAKDLGIACDWADIPTGL